MKSNLNWGKLVSENRAKAIGVPWSNEEQHAVFVLKIPADAVRAGILTQEELEGSEWSAGPTLEDVRNEARSLGIEFTEVATREVLLTEIKLRKQKQKDSVATVSKANIDTFNYIELKKQGAALGLKGCHKMKMVDLKKAILEKLAQ